MPRSTVTLEELKARLPLSALLIAFQFPQPRSAHYYRSRCLVHDGKNPTSFSADLPNDRWYCFACQRGGDQIDLVMAVCGCAFTDAVRWMADHISVPTSRISYHEPEQRQQARSEVLRELDEEEGLCLDIEQSFQVWFRNQRSQLPPKEEWDAKTYNRALWLDYLEDELDATSEKRAELLQHRRRALYATS